MAKQHAERFLKAVEQARQQIKELSIQQVPGKVETSDGFRALDRREAQAYARGGRPRSQGL